VPFQVVDLAGYTDNHDAIYSFDSTNSLFGQVLVKRLLGEHTYAFAIGYTFRNPRANQMQPSQN
jgi:hypothetical protein